MGISSTTGNMSTLLLTARSGVRLRQHFRIKGLMVLLAGTTLLLLLAAWSSHRGAVEAISAANALAAELAAATRRAQPLPPPLLEHFVAVTATGGNRQALVKSMRAWRRVRAGAHALGRVWQQKAATLAQPTHPPPTPPRCPHRACARLC